MKYIDMSSYKRKSHFEHFLSMENPTMGFTVKVDVTNLYNFAKRNNLSFYSAYMHVAALAGNKVPELRQRIHDGKIVEYENCPTSGIEALDDGTYVYCTLHHDMSWDEYISYADKEREKARLKEGLSEDSEAESMFFITIIPWFHYEDVMMPTGGHMISNPQICCGKFVEQGARKIMPLTLYAHHGLVDGIHVAKFFKYFEEEVNSL